MSEAVSARPELLSNFATSQSKKAADLDTQRIDDSTSFFSFISADGTGACDQACVDVINTHAANLVYELSEIALFVQIVNEALELADQADPDGVIRFDGDLQPYLDAAAAVYGVNFTDMALSDVVTKDDIGPLNVGTVPENSGFVNDPVCTATGHLLIDARDFVMPPRLDVLTFRRTYASRDLTAGAFGPGWWSWTECRSEVLADGSFVFHGPDALEFSVEPFGDGTFVSRPELDVQVVQTGDDRFELRWGRRSRYPYQQWTFTSGRLADVTGPFHGTTTFVHGSHGLARIDHDSGRSLTLRWSHRRVVAVESSDGRGARFSYDRRGRLVGVDNAISPETYEVDDDGHILSITDADGVRTVAMTYDDAGRVVEQITAAGFITRFGYDQPRRTTLADRDHNPLSVYTHDERGRVEMYATGGGFRFTRRFDNLGRVVSQRDPDGTSFALTESFVGGTRIEEFAWSTGSADRYTYDHLDRLVEQSSPDKTTRFEYHDGTIFPARIVVAGDEGITLSLRWANGIPVRLEDGDGVVDCYDVRPDGTIAAVTNAYEATTRYDVHPSGAVARIHYADGRVVHHDRDDAGRLVGVVDAAGGRGELRYSAAGRLLSVIDAAGSITTLHYDRAGSPSRVIAADGAATEFLFDDQQRAIGVRFANGDTIGLTLDEFGRQVALDVAGARWVTERDNAGRIVKRVDPTGRESVQTYGELVQWSELGDAAGETSRVEMDLARRVTSLRTRDAHVDATYAATGLVRSETAPDGTSQQYEYTSGGRVARVVQESNTVECRYDEAGQLVATNTGSGWWTFDRDLYGQITRRVSPAGREQRYEYDVLGNVTAVEVDRAVWRFDYDPMGRVVRTTDPTGRAKSFVYDAMGRMVESRDGRAVPLRYEYDLRGRIAAMVDSTGGVVRYEHDPTGTLTSVVDQLGRQTVVRYDAAGRHRGTDYFDRDGSPMMPDPFAGVAAPDDTSVDFSGATLGRVDSADGSVTRWALPHGDHVELRRDADGMAILLTSPGFARTIQRDSCGRIVAVSDSIDEHTTTTTLRRDLAGRVVEQAVDGAVTTYSYDDAGQLVTVEGPQGVSEWEYDDVGRLVRERRADGDRRFEYDAAHELVRLVEGGEVTTFEYDVRGRRVRASGRHDIVYVWGRDRLEAVVTDGLTTSLDFDESDRLSRFGAHHVQWSDGGPIPQPSSVDGRPVISVGASTFGSVNDDGTVAWRPFGLSDAWGDGGGPEPAWHPYFGVAVDGVVWLGARPYDIATRQFLAPDPLAPVPGGAGVTSPYTYAYNDPINVIDPTGRQGQPISMEDFNDIVDRHTGVQWGNVAAVGIAVVVTVAVVVVTAGAAAPLALSTYALIGAGAGLATGVAREGLQAATHTGDGTFDGGPIVKDTLLGLAGGFLGGVGGRAVAPLASRLAGATGLPTRVATGGATFLTEGAAGAGEATVGEAYDVAVPAGMRPYLGGDGRFDAGQIPVNAGINAVVGTAADELVPRIPGVGGGADIPTNAAADPSTTPVNVSPAPDLPASAPSAGGDSAPASGGADAAASTGADPVPSADADPAPSGAADPGPRAGADPVASGAADPAPSVGAESAPSAGADPAPSAAADPAPSAGTDPAPSSAGGDAAPSAGSDSGPGAGAGSTSSNAAADPAQSGGASPAPAGAGDPAPSSAAADPAPSASADPAPASAAGDPAPSGAGGGDPVPVGAGDRAATAAADPTSSSAGADPAPIGANGDETPSGSSHPSANSSGGSTAAAETEPPPLGAADQTDAAVEVPAGTAEAGVAAVAARPVVAATIDTPVPAPAPADADIGRTAGDPPAGAPAGDPPSNGPIGSGSTEAASEGSEGDGPAAPRSYANAKGEAGEIFVGDQLQANNIDIVGQHVRIRTADSNITEVDYVVRGRELGSQVRITDADGDVVLDVSVPAGEVHGIEVKNGPRAELTEAQRTGFPQVRDTGGTVADVDAGGSLSVGDEFGPMHVDIARIDVEPEGPTYTADAKGRIGEAHVGNQLDATTSEIVGTHVRVTTSDGGTTEIDYVVRGGHGGSQVCITDADGSVVLDVHVPEGELVGLEVKNGPDAHQSTAQIARFPNVRESGGAVSRVDDGSALVTGQRLPGFDIHIVRVNVPVSSP